MWFLIPVVGLAVLAVIAIASNEEKVARENWRENYIGAQKTVESHRRNIEVHLANANNSYQFSVLNDAYYSSYKVADFIYKLLTDAKVCLIGINKMIMAADQKRDELKKNLNIGYLQKSILQLF